MTSNSGCRVIFFCVLLIASQSVIPDAASFFKSSAFSNKDGSGISDIEVVANGTSEVLQFGDEAIITLEVINMGPEGQSAVGVVSIGLIRGLSFPTTATCDVDIIVQRQNERGATDFALLWIVDDLQNNESRECIITLPVSSAELGSEIITFTHTETLTDPNPNNDNSSVKLQFLGIGGVPVPTLSLSGLGILIVLVALVFIATYIRRSRSIGLNKRGELHHL